MVKSTKEALCELKRYIHTVECNGALLASKNSSFINDYLRAFVANNTVPRNDKGVCVCVRYTKKNCVLSFV